MNGSGAQSTLGADCATTDTAHPTGLVANTKARLPPPIVTDFAYSREASSVTSPTPLSATSSKHAQGSKGAVPREDGGGAKVEKRPSLAPSERAFFFGCDILACELSMSSSTVSSRAPSPAPKPHHHFKHHEPAPRRFLRRLHTLVHPNHSSSSSHQHHRKDSRSSSVFSTPASSAPPSRPRSRTRTSSLPRPLPRTDPSAQRPALKIRICTFNMASSLPEPDGDLSDFLGSLEGVEWGEEWESARRSRKRRRQSSGSSKGASLLSGKSVGGVGGSEGDEDEGKVPRFPLTKGHPYHIVVVCGQECAHELFSLMPSLAADSDPRHRSYRVRCFGGSSTDARREGLDEHVGEIPLRRLLARLRFRVVVFGRSSRISSTRRDSQGRRGGGSARPCQPADKRQLCPFDRY